MKRKAIRTISVLLACGMLFLTACSPEYYAQVEQALAEAGKAQAVSKTEDKSDSLLEEAQPEDHVYEIEKKKFKEYFGVPEDVYDIELAFMDGAGEVPYISLDGAKDMLIMVMKDEGADDYDLKLEAEDDKVTMTRETGYPMTIDFTENTIEFYDLDAFLRKQENSPLMDVTSLTGFNDKGEPEYLQATANSFERYGDPVTFHPGDYGIDLIAQNGEYYIPLQLLSDVILSHYSVNTLFNGENLCLIGGGETDPLAEQIFIDNPPKERSDALIDFNYRELCFALDAIYGLKEQHNIESFDSLFKQTGLIVPLMSKDPQDAGQALADLTTIYLDDKHTGFKGQSYMMKEPVTLNFGTSIQQSLDDKDNYKDARSKFYPDEVPGYEEVGNTAFITFDGFVYQQIDYYDENVKAEDHLDDTMGLMIYSFEQITRDGSPVENVVLDMSCNGGGVADAAAYTIGAFIGNGSISIMNPLSGALVTESFKADLNLDRKFDDNDNLLKYNLFCMTAPNSFSCGNLVPSVLKNSHRVTNIGQTSGGGACVVHFLSTADGCAFQLSGPLRLAYTKNGSFYDIDQGVEPDFVIAKPELFYDREYMSKYVNELVGN
jgi:hypothetical protein